ncbi:hypothetical protein NFHSH190041_17050 [Shewanella sp. NFH-SH190041]|uniref:hypothetical protein n=1 Tax=Shewanella sp. NFH-SH190041 TaxID=2950245 RepID=UPI0021C26598|nr:hypothetical protein [Shewanella sp. NFH-SH190041]BDM64253.1 hypothetical protein NFHSH190041_17050 [Shewanella sp. NFH-SH190041]
MKSSELLTFLDARQPMPSDKLITKEECNTFIEAINYFKSHKSNKCIPLFIFSVSDITGLGMYESISDVLMFQDNEYVKKYLRLGLKTGSDAVRYRCCWWASDIEALDLDKEIIPLVNHANQNVGDAAKAFVQLIDEIKL